MNIEYVGRHVTLDSSIRELAEEKVGKLAKFLGEPVDVHVTLSSEKHRQIAEVRITQRRGEFIAREEGAVLLDVLQVAFDKIDGQARRASDRRVDKRRRPARKPPTEAAVAENPVGDADS